MDDPVARDLQAMVASSVLGRCATSVAGRDPTGATFVFNCGEIGPGDAMSEHTLMYGASLTKQLMGVLLALNVLEGAMRIDDHVRSYLPELPRWADDILLRHLAHHTSGLPSEQALRDRGAGRCEGWDNRRVLRHIADEIEPARPPGTALEYSGRNARVAPGRHTGHLRLGARCRYGQWSTRVTPRWPRPRLDREDGTYA